MIVAMMVSLASLALVAGFGTTPYRPSPDEVAANYRRADVVSRNALSKAVMLNLVHGWNEDGTVLWIRDDKVGGERVFLRIDLRDGSRKALFDHEALSGLLEKEGVRGASAKRLPFSSVTLRGEAIFFSVEQQVWKYLPGEGRIEKSTEREMNGGFSRGSVFSENRPGAFRGQGISFDGKKETGIVGGNVGVRPAGGGEWTMLTTDGTEQSPYVRPIWSGDGQKVVAGRLTPGDRKKVFLLQLSPPDNGPSQLKENQYDRPGDKVDAYGLYVIDAEGRTGARKVLDVEYGGFPRMQRSKDGRTLRFAVMDRGYGRWRLFGLDANSGELATLVDDDPETFVDSTSKITQYMTESDEILYSSERDGWHHLYISDGRGGTTQVTKGNWVVRGVQGVDEAKRRIYFSASGMKSGEDPYFVHFYRVDFNGKNLVELTPAAGNHAAAFSPDRRYLVDTYSTVTEPQVHELRDGESGRLIAPLGRADVSELMKTGWKPAEPFSAKGRDGRTDIYGIVYRPSNFDPTKTYPVVEDIYAGPQDSFVRKSFSVSDYDQSIAELGFIVVKIDGMGTRNRSKAFHDVCYKNLKDAGFPDRILWMKALAQKEPAMDLSRVGVFGTSAGGQNAAGAVLFHPDFYKVAIASCGCHDNRLDKIWWNEQWMGLMGPHYGESSNIDNAGRLKGDLMLIVGELDSNVPPESTYRLAAALQGAGKEFEFVVIPNANHTAGGPYGERKRRDFLVRHLFGVEPPNPNRG